MIPLTPPDSTDLNRLVHGASARKIYRILYENQNKALTMAEIRQIMGIEAGKQEHLNRRLRDLYKIFEIKRTRRGSDSLYQLIKQRDVLLNTESINNKDRAYILRDKRCAQCGRTPMEDHIKLHVDHKIPQEWGGTNDIGNLQPLCSECNEGKRNFYATYDEYANKIKVAANCNEPHQRIGELLKAFKGEFVPSDLIEIVANSKQYQDDWQKRLRELRTLGWIIQVDKRKEARRFKTYYAVKHYESWPEGNIRSEITRRETQAKAQKPESV
jgi:predicted Zn-ribbon and HTH transcriptional regulator